MAVHDFPLAVLAPEIVVARSTYGVGSAPLTEAVMRSSATV